MTSSFAFRGDDPSLYTSLDFGNMLKRLLYRARRDRNTLKVDRLAARMSIGSSTLYAYFSGEILPPGGRLDDLLSLLDASPADRRWFHEVRDELALRKPSKDTDSAVGPVFPPVVEIVRPDGTVEIADLSDVGDVPPEDVDLTGAYVIEDIEEHIWVDNGRTTSQVRCGRTIRATQDSVQDFLYSVECPPVGLHRLVIEADHPVAVTRVIRVTDSSYVFHLHLPWPLAEGDRYTLGFSLRSQEDPSRESRGVYGKRQFVDTGRIFLSIEFSGARPPARVRWFAARFPLGAFPDGFDFPEDNRIPGAGRGPYEKEFDGTGLPAGRIVGLVWDYAD